MGKWELRWFHPRQRRQGAVLKEDSPPRHFSLGFVCIRGIKFAWSNGFEKLDKSLLQDFIDPLKYYNLGYENTSSCGRKRMQFPKLIRLWSLFIHKLSLLFHGIHTAKCCWGDEALKWGSGKGRFAFRWLTVAAAKGICWETRSAARRSHSLLSCHVRLLPSL